MKTLRFITCMDSHPTVYKLRYWLNRIEQLESVSSCVYSTWFSVCCGCGLSTRESRVYILFEIISCIIIMFLVIERKGS